MIQNVVVQINKLTNSLMVDIKSCQDDENRAQAAFDKVKRALLAIISRLTNDITKTNTQINNMNACIKKTKEQSWQLQITKAVETAS